LPIDNWSEYGSVKTEWTKIKIVGTPKLGDHVVIVDLHDWSFSASNGNKDSVHNLTQIEWGITGDCRGSTESSMRINLVGTPFAYQPQYEMASGNEAHGGVICEQNNQSCTARCGGWCGYCGFGAANETRTATLAVINREDYDGALYSFYGDAREALHTTTLTTTTQTTTSTFTSTVTSSTVTSTSTTHKAHAFASLLAHEENSTTSPFAFISISILVIGLALLIGFMFRRGVHKRLLDRTYGRFDDSNVVESRCVQAQSLGGSFPPGRHSNSQDGV